MMKRIKFLICIAAAGLILTSCNEAAKSLPLDYDEIDQVIDTPWVEYSVPASEVIFSEGEDNITINKGDTYTYNFTVSPKKANAYGLNWVSNNPDVATINNGVLTAVGGGEAVVTVSSIEEDLFDPIDLNVTVNVPLTGFDVSNPTLDLDLEEAEGIRFNYVPEDTTDLGVTFTSSNPDVAVVDEEGLVTSVGAGTATITISGKRNISSTVAVTVSDKSTPIESLTLTPAETNLEVEHDLRLDLTINPEKANYELIQWISDNEDVAKVDENGVVTAIDAGTAHITAKIEYRGRTKTATSTITVFENVADELLLDTDNFELDTSAVKVRQLNAIYKFNGETISPSRSNLEFISSNESVAIVNESGLVTALSKGSATITARDTKQNLEVVATVNVASSATSITITPSSYKIQPGENVTIKATVAPSNADINIVDWAFSDATLYKNLVVDGNTIKFVAADKEGNLTITAKIGALNANATIQVADAAEGFGIIFNDGTKYQADYRGLNEEGYEEYFLPSINFAQGSIFSLYDFASRGRWAVELNPYSFGDTSGTGIFSSNYLSINTNSEDQKISYNVLKAFNADLYIQIKYGEDRLYVDLINGKAPSKDGTYTVRIGNNTYNLIKSDVNPDVEKKVAIYSLGGLIVEAGQSLNFYVDDEQITSKFGASGDDLDNLKYNNYVGTISSGFKVQANASGVSLFVDVWSDGGASFWLEGGNSSDHTDPENPVVANASYGIKHNGNPLPGVSTGVNDEGFDEYVVKSVSFNADDTFALYDYNTGSSWAVALNPYSFDDKDGTGANWKEFLTINEAQDKSYNVSYTVKKAFNADLYIQIKYGEDRLYVGLIPEEEQEIIADASYVVAIGANEVEMAKLNNELSDEEVLAGKVAVYATGNILSVAKGASVTFFMNGERLISHIGASPDGDESYNNYVGDISIGLKIQADAENIKVYLDIYEDGGASFWIEGGESNNHTDGNIPVVVAGYYLAGSINGWTISDEYKFAVDELDENHYAITNVELPEGSVFKVNDGVNSWFTNGHTYEGCGFSLDEDGNIKVAIDGIYTVNFYINSDDDNHVTLEKTGDIPIDTSESTFYLKGTLNGWVEKPEYILESVTENQFQIKGIEFEANDEFKIYDAGTGSWYGNASDWEGCGFEINEGGNIVVKEAGMYTVNFYVKGDNDNHITIVKETYIPEDAVAKVKMGENEFLQMERVDAADPKLAAKYELEFDILTSGDEFKFVLNEIAVVSNPNPDDLNNDLFNNYIGTAVDGYKVKVSSDSPKTMELMFWVDGEIMFWLPGGDSEDHIDPSIISEGYGLLFENGTKVLAVATGEKDHEDRDQYKIANYHFQKDEKFTLYNFAAKEGWVVNIDAASFGGSEEYLVKEASNYKVLQEFYADVYIKLKQGDDQIYFGLKTLSLSSELATIQVGNTDSSINIINWGGDNITVTPANPAIATVALGDEADGKIPVSITGVASGSTTITISDGINSAKIAVTITSEVVKYSITFCVNYGTTNGYSIYIIGDFCGWDIGGAYKMSWNDGNNWMITITQDSGTVFEFKFVHAETDNPTNLIFEGGSNRTITFDSTRDANLNWQP